MTEIPTYDEFKSQHFDCLAEACRLLTSCCYGNGYIPTVGSLRYNDALKLMIEAGVMPPNDQAKRFDRKLSNQGNAHE